MTDLRIGPGTPTPAGWLRARYWSGHLHGQSGHWYLRRSDTMEVQVHVTSCREDDMTAEQFRQVLEAAVERHPEVVCGKAYRVWLRAYDRWVQAHDAWRRAPSSGALLADMELADRVCRLAEACFSRAKARKEAQAHE